MRTTKTEEVGIPKYKDEVQPNRDNDHISVATHPLSTIVQNERLRIITDELLSGKPKRVIITEYAEKWQTKPITIKHLLTEAITNLHHVHSGNTVEEMRTEQVAKLEELYNQATIAEKLKIIDLVSDTLGLYDNNVTVKTDDVIKINLGA